MRAGVSTAAAGRRASRASALAAGVFLVLCAVGLAGRAAAETTRLFLLDPHSQPGLVGMAASAFHGDGFFDANGDLGSQANGLTQERLSVWFATALQRGIYLGLDAPFIHRTIDQVASGSADATGTGLGDVEMAVGWRLETPRAGFRPGVELNWKTASGSKRLSVEEVDRGNPSEAPTGTGGNDVGLWAGTDWRGGPVGLGAALGYRFRFPTIVAWFWNSALVNRTEPEDRILLQARGSVDVAGWVELFAIVEGFHEATDNQVWAAWATGGVGKTVGRFRARIGWETPIAGKFYPDVPPVQFQERDPLLGQRLWAELVWLLGEGAAE